MANRPDRQRSALEHPVLRDDNGERSIDLSSLMDELSTGRSPPTGLLRYRPWTGEHFAPLSQIPELRDVLEDPRALAVRHFASAPSYLGAAIVMGVLVLLGLIQLRLSPMASSALALSWDNVWLHERPWVILTGHLFHSDLRHLLVNVVLLSYCTHRVERVLGLQRCAMLLLGTVLLSAFLWLQVGLAPVIGASMFMYTMWVAQIAIGFRFGHQLPSEVRGFYGWGNAMFFIPIVVLSVYEPQSSQIGHALGAFVGLAGVALLSPVWLSDRLRKRTWLLFVPPIVLLLGLLLKPLELELQPSEWNELSLSLPPQSVTTENGWLVGADVEIRHSELWVATAKELTAGILQHRWLSENEHQLTLLEHRALGEHSQPGEQSVSINLWRWTGDELQIEEHSIRHGELVRRVSCSAPKHSEAALQHCSEWLENVIWAVPNELVELRELWQSNAQNVRTGQSLQHYLSQIGWVNEADRVLTGMSRRIDSHRWDAHHDRIKLRLKHPQLVRWAEDRIWVQQLLQSYPMGQEALVLDILKLGDREQDCPLVQLGIDRMVFLSRATASVLRQRLEHCTDSATDIAPEPPLEDTETD